MAQRIEHLTTDQKVGGSSPSERAEMTRFSRPRHFSFWIIPFRFRSSLQKQLQLASFPSTGFLFAALLRGLWRG